MTVCELIEQRISESLFASLKREQEVLQLCGRTVRNRVFALVRVGARFDRNHSRNPYIPHIHTNLWPSTDTHMNLHLTRMFHRANPHPQRRRL